MSGYTLGEYLDGAKPDYEISDEATEEIRLAFQALKDVCTKHNAPFIATVCIVSEGDKYGTRMSTHLPINRTPIEMLVARHMFNEGLHAGVGLGLDIIQTAVPAASAPIILN